MATDFTAVYCRRLHHFPVDCDHLVRPEVCKLLKEFPLKEIFATGRCRPQKFLTSIVRRKLNRYRDLLCPDEHAEALAFELERALEERRLTESPTLYGLVGYFKTAAFHAVARLLEEEGLFTPKTCGYCIHLSRSKPFRCQCQYITVADSEQGAERKIARTGKRVHKWYNYPRRPSDNACKAGFERYALEPETLMSSSSPPPDQAPASVILTQAVEVLQARAATATRPKERTVLHRHLSIFIGLIHSYERGYSENEAVKEVAADLNITVKMLNRDLRDMLQFLSEKMGQS